MADPAALERLASRPGVLIRRPARPVPQSLTPGEGVAVTGATAWLGQGTQGAGVKVAIVDAGFRQWRDRVAERDLPPGVHTKDTYLKPLEVQVIDRTPRAGPPLRLDLYTDFSAALGRSLEASRRRRASSSRPRSLARSPSARIACTTVRWRPTARAGRRPTDGSSRT